MPRPVFLRNKPLLLILASCGLLAAFSPGKVLPIAKGEESTAIESDSIQRQLRTMLEKPASVDFVETPLTDVLQLLQAQSGVRMLIDTKALEEAGVSTDVRLSIKASEMSCAATLQHLFRPLELTWVYRDDALVVTTKASSELELEIRVYPVRDLVLEERASAFVEDFDSLIELITGSVAITSWSDVGGMATIKQYSPSGALVISQTREVHEKIDNLLTTLRRVRDEQGLSSTAVIQRSPASRYEPARFRPTDSSLTRVYRD
jgi:type II secretory pathway component GspD/PulD (secretin)